METVKVVNLKTGRTVTLLKKTFDGLVKAGKGKDFDLVSSDPKKEEAKTEEVKTEEAPKAASPEEIPTVDTNDDGKRSAKEMIDAIRKADSIEAVNVLIDGEDRKTVLKAAAERKNALK